MLYFLLLSYAFFRWSWIPILKAKAIHTMTPSPGITLRCMIPSTQKLEHLHLLGLAPPTLSAVLIWAKQTPSIPIKGYSSKEWHLIHSTPSLSKSPTPRIRQGLWLTPRAFTWAPLKLPSQWTHALTFRWTSLTLPPSRVWLLSQLTTFRSVWIAWAILISR